LDFNFENAKSENLVKQSQALLRSNLTRDSLMQIALKNAQFKGKRPLVPLPESFNIIQAFLPMP